MNTGRATLILELEDRFDGEVEYFKIAEYIKPNSTTLRTTSWLPLVCGWLKIKAIH